MRTSRALLCVVVAIVVLLPSCKPPKNGSFIFTVKANYGGNNFAIDGTNTDPNGRRIQVSVLKFYLSHIKLVKTDNSEVEIKEVMLCDMADPASLTFSFDDLKGDFKAIKFSCGVDSIQNETDPNTITDDSHPLSNASGMYWSWLKYQFETMEAKADTSTNASGTFNWYPIYHIGGNAYYRTTQLSKTFSICCETESKLNLVLDVEKIFFGAQTLDIISERITQSGSGDNPAIAPKFADNFSQAFSIE